MISHTTNQFRVAWVTRSFLDYRIPVFKSLDELVGHQLFVVYSKDYVPERVCRKLQALLGDRAVGLSGEWKIGPEDKHGLANTRLSFRFHPALLNAVPRINPDVLVGDGFSKWTIGALFQKLTCQTPLVICYERTSHTERNIQWYRTLYRRAVLRFVDAMCCSGRLCGEYTQSLGIEEERITYGHMVADTNGLSKACSSLSSAEIEVLRKKWDVRGILLLYVGRLIALKGLVHLLEAWTSYELGMGDCATLMLVGDGDLSEELKAHCRDKGLKSVRFTGAVDYDEIARYYASSDALIIPTLEDNWSLVVPEAMVCGLPVLCSKYNGCWPELVQSGQNGWVFDPLDPEDILRVLKLCYDRRVNLRGMGERSEQIVRKFSPHSAAKSIYDACTIALSRHNKFSRPIGGRLTK